MKYVLGGGIAGLIWAYYHPEYKVVADKKGGAMASQLTIGPRWLHANGQTEAFVQGLGLELADRKVVKAGIAGSSSSDAAYMLKTRGIKGEVFDRAFTSRHEVLLEPSLREITARLIQIMESENRFVVGKVTAVDLDAQRFFVEDQEWRAWEHIVNTVPLPMFIKILCRPDKLSWGGEYAKIPVLFNHHVIADGTWPWPGLEYVYVPDPSYPFSRITVMADADLEHVLNGLSTLPLYACVEYPGEDALKATRGVGTTCPFLKQLVPSALPCVSSVYFPYGRIVSREMPSETLAALSRSGVWMFGRFAEWDDTLLTHDLIRKAEATQ